MMPRAVRRFVVCTEDKHFNKPSTFRAGILQIVAGQSTTDWAGVYAVNEISGDMMETFESIENFTTTTNDGRIDKDELRVLLAKIGKEPSDADVVSAMKQLDTNGDGFVDRDEFKVWYLKSEHVVESHIEKSFDKLDSNNNGMITRDDVAKLLAQLDLGENASLKDEVEKVPCSSSPARRAFQRQLSGTSTGTSCERPPLQRHLQPTPSPTQTPTPSLFVCLCSSFFTPAESQGLIIVFVFEFVLLFVVHLTVSFPFIHK